MAESNSLKVFVNERSKFGNSENNAGNTQMLTVGSGEETCVCKVEMLYIFLKAETFELC